MTIQEIKAAVHSAAGTNQKIAMFHLQVLKNADDLDGISAEGFCSEIGVPLSYRTEFTKMISLARLMREQGLRVAVV